METKQSFLHLLPKVPISRDKLYLTKPNPCIDCLLSSYENINSNIQQPSYKASIEHMRNGKQGWDTKEEGMRCICPLDIWNPSILLDEDEVRPQPLREVESRQRINKNKKKLTSSGLATSETASGASGSLRPLPPLEGMAPVPPPQALLDQIRSWPHSQKRIWDYSEYYDFILNGRQRGEKSEDEKKEDKKMLEKPRDDGEVNVKRLNPPPPTQPRSDMARSTSMPSTSTAIVENRRKKRIGQWPQMNIRFGKHFRFTSGSIKVQATARVPQAYEYDGITIVRTWQRESELSKEFTLSMSATDTRRLYHALKRVLNNAK